ncbi:MAG: hypothetical protein JXB32_19200 [Deltaproteobacteria bacterium]|nr:hypothetical protein [Deltaproteobacteria bacterium]
MTKTVRGEVAAWWLVAAGLLVPGAWACGPATPPPEPVPEPEEELGPPPVSAACLAAAEQGAPRDAIDLRSTGPSAMGGRSRQVIREALEAKVARFRYCRDAAIREGADASAGIALRFTIIPSGEVCQAEVLSNPSHNDTFAACALAVVRGLAFGESPHQGEGDYRPSVGVIYAFQDTGVD